MHAPAAAARAWADHPWRLSSGKTLRERVPARLPSQAADRRVAVPPTYLCLADMPACTCSAHCLYTTSSCLAAHVMYTCCAMQHKTSCNANDSWSITSARFQWGKSVVQKSFAAVCHSGTPAKSASAATSAADTVPSASSGRSVSAASAPCPHRARQQAWLYRSALRASKSNDSGCCSAAA